MTERKTSLWSKILIISIATLIFMSVFSNALVVGERLRTKSIYLEYIYYILIVFIICFGILYPFFGVLFAPIFSLEKLHTEDGKARKKWCKKLSGNLLKIPELKQIDKYFSLYDEIFIGTPIWNSKGVPAINAFLNDDDICRKVTGLIITSGGGDVEKCVKALEEKFTNGYMSFIVKK